MKYWSKRKIKIVRIACKYCGFDQIFVTCATTTIQCFNCCKSLIIPKSGKAELIGANVAETLK